MARSLASDGRWWGGAGRQREGHCENGSGRRGAVAAGRWAWWRPGNGRTLWQAAAEGRVPIPSTGIFMSFCRKGVQKKLARRPVHRPRPGEGPLSGQCPRAVRPFRISLAHLEQHTLPKVNVSRRRNTTFINAPCDWWSQPASYFENLSVCEVKPLLFVQSNLSGGREGFESDLS